MLGNTIIGNVDLASVAIWAFWVFFAGLIFYIQRENMREGYPMRDDSDQVPANESLFPLPAPKTFHLRNDRGTVTVPSLAFEEANLRTDLAIAPSSKATGSPWIPTGDPMVDGVGPAAWAPRRDIPELDAHGHAKIQPMSTLPDFRISFGNDPRGMPVVGGDNKVAGVVVDIWVDVPEQLIRYLEVELTGGGRRLVQMTMCRVHSNRIRVRALYAHNWDGIPTIKGTDQVTLLEEEKIMAYIAGGTLYATERRTENVLP
ncbi:photosynthetic reaction center H subunit [Loktanella sp. DSM 29012]|uniref:Photosynthetic reaction center subunit H n=1 Tax=Loktanella gaetbuli TaxID=2881335 RepID=A0ABS8BTD2_9RHOB|nr:MULTISPECIES: photosynthetic reaction center subunit H [Loktanella]MCB5198978.1 photosynthetic reaction center subunit H [Loktanella gaetbuli]SEP67540.1 photosynthetic reaction center H subunit [Loktanella sp. DSM 29012]